MTQWNETAWFAILTGAAVKGTAVLAAAWLAAALLRRRSAAARHMVWTLAFAAILILPLLAALLPVVRIPVSDTLPAASLIFQDTGTASAETAATHSAATGHPAPAIHSASRRIDWKMWLMLLWAAGSLLALARTLAAYWMAWRVCRSAKPWAPAGFSRSVDVLQTEPGSMPVTLWLWRSVILMPADAGQWSEERRRIVLLHEFAHVRRGDALTQLLARAAMALYWWNPMAWAAWREFIKQRERAADDLVLQAGARPSDYASHLLEVTRSLQTRAAVGWAAAAMARRSQLEGRLLAILDPRVDRAEPSRAARFATAILAMLLILPLAAIRAQDSQATAGDVDATIRAAQSQKSYETLDAAAQAATQSKKYDAAQKLLEAAVAIRAQTAGEQSVEYGVGLVKLAELEQKTDRNAGAALLTRAAQILGQHPEAAAALKDLGMAALMKKDYAQAFNYYQQAQLVDPAHAAMALMWMAVVRETEKNPEEAERLYQSALAEKDTAPADSAVLMRVYGAFLRQQSRDDDAKQFEDRALAIQRAEAKPAPPRPAGVNRVGGGTTAPVPLKKEEPQYTEEARAAKLQGTSVVQVVIGVDGRAHDGRILREVGLGLDENALEAISQWEFQPGTKDGQPVPVLATIEVNFRLL
jgi:TonB family protein